MTTRAVVPVPKTFDDLVKAVRAALILGQARADRAYLESYRNTGFLIDAHLLFHEKRAGYGEQVIPRLARVLGCNERLLYRCLRFVREYPILTGRSELGWSHYRVLIEVKDRAERKTLEAAARKNHWIAEVLERHVRALNAANATPAEEASATASTARHKPLVLQRGRAGVYRVATVEGKQVVDLGFTRYLDLNEEQAREFKDGALVELDGASRITPADDATKADLFNYRVELLRVVDGDTLWISIYLRPREWVKHKVRLRGLDCGEIATPEGRAAKRFVDALFLKATAIAINTTKPDKYDRYLADVLLTTADGEVYLNNALLENAHAVRKDAWEFGDWEPEWVR